MGRRSGSKQSAGLLLYRWRAGGFEVLLVHPGGPFWRRKDLAAWSIPKGEFEPDEDPLDAARREFAEETGATVAGKFIPLTPVKQSGGKVVTAWAVEGDWDATLLRSNTFALEWPPGSGVQAEFPEVDRAAWLPLAEARQKILSGQLALLDQLEALLAPRESTGRKNL
jgi:predicted NUDIX family NTP pyrophosphohydrolase